MHVAVAGVHVQRDEHAAAQHFAVERVAASEQRLVIAAGEDRFQRRLELVLPRHDIGVALQVAKRRVEAVVQILPARAHRYDERTRIVERRRELAVGRPRFAAGSPQVLRIGIGEELRETVRELHLVADRHLDVQALDAVGVVAEPVERNDDVLVDLECVRVLGDRRRARAVEPELLARFGGYGDESLAAARIGDPDHLRRCLRDGVVALADDVAEQDHVRATVPLRFRRIADRLHVPRIEMFEARKLNARSGGRVGRRIEEALDLDDRRRRFARLAEELEAERPDGRWHPVQHEARADDDAVAPFLLHAWQPCEELVGDVLAETHLAEEAPGNGEHFALRHGAAVVTEPFELECRSLRIVDLAEVVIDARHLQPLRIRRHHPPRDEIIECRAPQHGLLATGVDGDIPADARRIRRRRIAREHESVRIGNVHRAFRDDPGAAVDRRDRFRVPLQCNSLDAGEPLELLGVDHGRARVERDRAAGIARAAAARNDRQAELDARGDDAAHFVFRIRMQHDEWVLDAPVGCVGHVRYALEAVERDVVLARIAAKRTLHAFSQCCGVRKPFREAIDGRARGVEQLADLRVAIGVEGRVVLAAPIDLV